MEITNRDDIGADLKCPQLDETGKPQPSYNLIRAIWPGDLVFHYSTNITAVVGASIAGGPLQQRDIIWISHRVIGKPKNREGIPRAGWWLPLYGFATASVPLRLTTIQDPIEDSWIRAWIDEKRRNTTGPVAAPFQRYKNKLRAAQGYLSKMPLDFVNRWHALQRMTAELTTLQDKMTPLGQLCVPEYINSNAPLKFKNDEDYFVTIKATCQRRSRQHERLVRSAAAWFSQRGAKIQTPHPIDLRIVHPKTLIIEAKLARDRNPIFAIREAIGQLFEYRHFAGPRDATLCILLDADPGCRLTDYVENHIGIAIFWVIDEQLIGGPRTEDLLSAFRKP